MENWKRKWIIIGASLHFCISQVRLTRILLLPLRDLLSFAIWGAGLARGTVTTLLRGVEALQGLGKVRVVLGTHDTPTRKPFDFEGQTLPNKEAFLRL